MNKKLPLLYAAFIALLVSSVDLHASLFVGGIEPGQTYGYIKILVNQSPYFAGIQTLDTSQNPRIVTREWTAARAPEMRNCSNEFGYIQIGCFPYIVKPGNTIEMEGFVVPWEWRQGQGNTNRYMKVSTYWSNGTINRSLYIQDKAGVISAGPWLGNWTYVFRKTGNVNFFIDISTQGTISIKNI